MSDSQKDPTKVSSGFPERDSLKAGMFLMAFLLAGTLGCFFSAAPQQAAEEALLPLGIKETYVAVLPFKNNTGKEELSVLGEMAADWITSGLLETGEGKVLSAGEVNRIIEKKKKEVPTDQPISPQEGVHYLIEGTYYELDSSLLFSSKVRDLEHGEIVFSFPVISGRQQDPMETIEILKQRILGYWVTKDRAGYERRPPVYEAYRAYLEAGKIWYHNPQKVGDLLEKAISLDSNFTYATVGYAHNLLNRGKEAKADSVITALAQRKEQFNRMELELFLGLKARISGNFEEMWKNWNSPYMLAFWGKNHILNQKANVLLYSYNQPELVLDLFKDIDFSSLDYAADTPTGSMYNKKIEALYRLGRYAEATELMMNAPFEFQRPDFIFGKIFRLAKMKAYDELEKALDFHMNSMPTDKVPPNYLRAFAILAFLANDDRESVIAEAQEYFQTIAAESNKFWYSAGFQRFGITIQEARLNYYLGMEETAKASPLIEQASLDESRFGNLALKGIYYAQMNKEAAAREVIEQLKQIKGKYDYGATEVEIAAIEAWLGHTDEAIALLLEARLKGNRISFMGYDGDWRMRPLFLHPDFKNKALAPFPLPELESTIEQAQIVENKGWFYLFGSVFTGLGLYFFWRYRQAKLVVPKMEGPEDIKAPSSELEDAFLVELKEIIEKNRNNPNFSLPQLCKAMGTSRAQIYRKIKARTGKSPAIYIRSLRLEKAMELLKTTDLNISEVAFEVGFNDLSYFSRSFSDEFGFSPSETRK